MKGPASSGQVLGIGSLVTSGSSMTTCWQAPLETLRGAIAMPCLARPIPVHGALSMPPISGFIRATMSSPTCRGSSTPSALQVRSLVPYRFISSGNLLMLPSGKRGCSNFIAGPPRFTSRSAKQPASSSTSTGSGIRRISPDSSRDLMYRESFLQAMSRRSAHRMRRFARHRRWRDRRFL